MDITKLPNDDFFFSAQATASDDFTVEDPSEALITEASKAAEGIPKAEEAAPKSEEKETPKFTKEELLEVFDEILFNGAYEETVTIRGKLKVKFRSRSGRETADVARRIDKAELNLVSTVSQYISLFNLSYSLIGYNNQDLSGLPVFTQADSKVKSRFDFISDLPSPVIAALSQALVLFDQKVFLACQEAEENF